MKLWKGRFSGRLDPEALRFSSSLGIDARLYAEDIEGSIAHVSMLAKRNIIPARDAAAIRKALAKIRREIDDGSFVPSDGSAGERFVADDIHMAIEQRLIGKVGKRGGKLHTGRSRNDQVALDERLFLRTAVHRTGELIAGLQRVLLSRAREYRTVLMPGYTHLQRAQPILLAHHLLAYIAMLDRDRGRFEDLLRRANRSPLGAGALAGTSHPIDRASVARALHMDGIVENSIDAVSDRDSLIEYVSACAVTMMHLSRMAEELVLWSSQEWRFVELADAYTTGSSIMPQKKNPDMAELVRGKTGRVYGDLLALLTMMKGLPLAYNRDMQEDKEPLFDADTSLSGSLRIMTLMFGSLQFRAERFEDELGSDFLLATEIADYLARKGMPFREAHAVTGAIVRTCAERGVALHRLPLEEYKRFSRLFKRDVLALFDPRASLSRKKSAGSTSPREVTKQITLWERRLAPSSRRQRRTLRS